jgi:RNA-splicing ligase RtcB
MNDIKSFIRERFQEAFRKELSDKEYNTIVEKAHKVKWKNKGELSEKERFIKNKLREARKLCEEK